MISVILITGCTFMSAQVRHEDDNYIKPRPGQDGKDVTWIPTPQPLVDAMLSVAKVTSDDFVIDLGSGDGRTVITAAKLGARARGIEYNPDLVEYSRIMAEYEGVTDRVEFITGDLYEADLSQATVITMFLLPSINVKLRPVLLELKPGTRIVSNSYGMGEWIPDDTASSARPCTSYCDALFWIVPAKVEGTWLMPDGELMLHQMFQMLTGTLKTGGKTIPVSEGRLHGDEISFIADFKKYSVWVSGNRIEGSAASDLTASKFSATRLPD